MFSSIEAITSSTFSYAYVSDHACNAGCSPACHIHAETSLLINARQPFEVGDKKSPAKPHQYLIVLKENAANCRRLDLWRASFARTELRGYAFVIRRLQSNRRKRNGWSKEKKDPNTFAFRFQGPPSVRSKTPTLRGFQASGPRKTKDSRGPEKEGYWGRQPWTS
jgi:hypothetical protein